MEAHIESHMDDIWDRLRYCSPACSAVNQTGVRKAKSEYGVHCMGAGDCETCLMYLAASRLGYMDDGDWDDMFDEDECEGDFWCGECEAWH